MPQLTRAPLPSRPIPQEIDGNDTRAQAAENRRRIEAYLELLRSTGTALPADPTRPKWLGIGQVGREAGVSIGIMRTGHPLRKKVDQAIPELGLAIIHVPPARDNLSLALCHDLFRALAPAQAQKIGIRSEAMAAFVDDLFVLLRNRAMDNDAAPVTPIIAEMREEADSGLLDLPVHVLRIIGNFDQWIAHSIDPGNSFTQEQLSALGFQDLMRIGMANTGLSQSRAAAIAGTRQATLHKWLHGQRSPNRQSYEGLRRLAEYFGLPRDALVDAISYSHGGTDFQFRLDDFPPQYRGKSARRLREAVRAQLTEEDLQLPIEALRTHIANLCEELRVTFQDGIFRKRMRDENRIDRQHFSETLKAELSSYCDDLAQRGKTAATQTAYYQHLEAFFSYALSNDAPSDLRLNPRQASIVHAASRALWDAYFTRLTNIGRRHMGAGFLINRAVVERMTAVAALFSEDGYLERHPALSSTLSTLPEAHRPKNSRHSWGSLPNIARLDAIYHDLGRLRKLWWKGRSREPVNGRSEIGDLLALENPMIAVSRILEHLHEKKDRIRKWKVVNSQERLNHHYATALRRLVLVHLFRQTALRIGMVPLITVGRPGCHLQWPDGGKPRLTIPANLFKNGASEVFNSGPYVRDLADLDGCYDDLREYINVARPRLLDGNVDDHLFLSWSATGGGRPVSPQVTRNEVVEFTAEAIGINAPPERRLIRANHLKPHHFRDILATSVLRKTDRNFALAGDAIHVTEETARQYYAFDTVEQRRPELQRVLADL